MAIVKAMAIERCSISRAFWWNVQVDEFTDYLVYRGTSETPDNLIYSGRAFAAPGAGGVDILLNTFAEDLLTTPWITPTGWTGRAVNSGVVLTIVESRGERKSVYFVADWDNAANIARRPSDPIDGRVDVRQPFLATSYNAVVNFYFEVGDVYGGDFDNGTEGQAAQLTLPAGTFANDAGKTLVVTDDDGATTMQIVKSCAEWCIFYVNARGGWDSFLIDGATKVVDTYERQSVRLIANPTRTRTAEHLTNGITRKMTFRTGWLTDDQAAKMHNLLGSVSVYAYNLNTEEVIPLILTGNECVYKSYRGEGAKLVRYDIDAEVSLEILRMNGITR